jgi:hypothetical protein
VHPHIAKDCVGSKPCSRSLSSVHAFPNLTVGYDLGLTNAALWRSGARTDIYRPRKFALDGLDALDYPRRHGNLTRIMHHMPRF